MDLQYTANRCIVIDKNIIDNNHQVPQEKCFHCEEWTQLWRVVDAAGERFFVCDKCDGERIKVRL